MSDQDGGPELAQAGRGWRRWIARLRLWQLIVAPLVVAVAAGMLLSGTLGSNSPQTPIGSGGGAAARQPPPRNLAEQVEQRSVWVGAPQMFDSVNRLVVDDGNGEAEVDLVDGVVTVTPTELADRAVDYEGRDIVVVGRVANDISIEAPSFPDGSDGFSDEARLVGAQGATAYVGSTTSSDRGSIIYAVGRIAAVGTTRDEDNRTRRAAYFVAVDVGPVETMDMSSSFRAALRAARRSR